MKDRLIELCENLISSCKSSSCEDCEHNNIDYPNCMSVHFADYLIENGVIVLPINAGDTIYRPFGVKGVESWIVETIVLHPEEIVFIDDSENSFKESDIGVSVFLTREEAEKALQGVK